MKVSTLSLGLILILAIAVAFTGCTSSTPATGGTVAPATTAGAAAAATTAAGSAAAGSGSSATGSDIFGTQSYEWTEYKMSTGSGSDQMVVYYKYNTKTGKCTMRFEGAAAANLPSGMQEMDCSSTGSTASASDPNEVNPDVKFVKVGTEVVTVPAGTFTADKYTATFEGTTGTYWIVRDKPMIKMESSSSQGSAVIELNGWG
ncbi:MAG TPA: hypothetical protein P5217_05420 [Methanoregulaceae archaeon]|nr:hypothetical protein [Methanoregulaceae archaeon]HRY75702.1 hypothetical protein [Methanoregulaceae archaeon]